MIDRSQALGQLQARAPPLGSPHAHAVQIVMAVNISDSELFQKLQSLGVDVGPVNDSTRAIYLRKYASLTTQSTVEASKTSKDQPPAHPTTSPSQCSKQSNQDKHAGHRTPPLPTTPPATPLITDSRTGDCRCFIKCCTDLDHFVQTVLKL